MASSLVSIKPSKKTAKSAATQVTKKKTSPPVQLSAEYIQDSTDEEEVKTSSGLRSKPLPVKETPIKPKANGKIKTTITPNNNIREESEEESVEKSGSPSDSSSGEEEDGEGNDEEEGSESEKEVEKSLEGDEENSSDDEEEEEFDAVRAKNPQSTVEPLGQVIEPRTNVPPYNPPKGFLEQAIDAELNAITALQRLDSEGKQIWHIEAPASVDIASLRQMTMEGIKKGNPVLSHGDNQYAFVQDLSETRRSTNAIILSTQGGYRTAPQPITQTLRLQLVVPKHATAALAAGVKKPVRQQPDDLKQRFQPLGAKRKRAKVPKLEKTKKAKIQS